MEADVLLLVSLMLFQIHGLMLNGDTANHKQGRRYQCSTPDIEDVRYFIGEECCDKKLAEIIGNSFMTGINFTLEDTLTIVQKKAQQSFKVSFEAIGSYGKILAASHYKGIRSCLVRLGAISVLLYETPILYDVNDKRAEKTFDNLNSEALFFDNLLETSAIEPPVSRSFGDMTAKRGHRQAINDTLPPGTHCDHHIRGGNKCCNGIIYQEMLDSIDKIKIAKRSAKSFGALTYLMKKHTQHVLNLAMEVFASNSDFQVASYHVGDNICKFNHKGKYFMVYENPQQSHFDIENPREEKRFDLHDRKDPLGTKQKEIEKITKSEKGWKIAKSGERKGFPMGTHCTEERTGSRCCSLPLFQAIDKAVAEQKSQKDYNPLDRRKMATAIRNAAEDILGTNMEAIVASDDFAYSSHSGDRMCKIQTGDYHIMVYATPRSKRSYPMHYEEYNDIGRQSKVGCEENNITYLEGFACCSPRLHFELLKVVDLSSGIAQNVARTVQRIFDTRFETVTSQSDFVWSSPGRDNRYCKVSIHGVHVLTFQSSHLPPLPREFESADIVQVPLTAAEIAAVAAVPFSPIAAPFAPFAPQFGVPPNFAPPNFAPPQFGPPMGQFGPGQFGPQPGQFGPQPGQFGPQPGQFGPQPGQFGPQPGQYGLGQSYGGASTVSPNTGSGYNCYSRDSWVITPTGNKRIDELTEREFVLSADDAKAIFVRVTMWLHKEDKTEASFLRIRTEQGNLLHLTNKHLIMRAVCSNETVNRLPTLGEAVFAEELKKGDCLFSYTNNQWKLDKIERISSIKQMGVYSPLTENGKIAVNGILTSCYSNLKNSQLQNTFFELAYRLRSMFTFVQEEVLQNAVKLPSTISLVDSLFQLISPQR